MKAILISIQPQWVELILNLIKKDEIRKGTALYKAINKLIEQQGVAPMLIYCTKKYDECLWYKKDSQRYVLNYGKPTNDYLNGKVVARFNATADLLELKMIEGGLYFTTPDRDCFTPNLDLNENAQIDNWQLLHYAGTKLGTQITDIHINALVIFDEPKEISEFRQWRDCGKCWHEEDCDCNLETCFMTGGKLTRAPQSYCYVEV